MSIRKHIGKLSFGIGWYPGEFFTLFNFQLVEVEKWLDKRFWTILYLQIAYLIIDITFGDL